LHGEGDGLRLCLCILHARSVPSVTMLTQGCNHYRLCCCGLLTPRSGTGGMKLYVAILATTHASPLPRPPALLLFCPCNRPHPFLHTSSQQPSAHYSCPLRIAAKVSRLRGWQTFPLFYHLHFNPAAPSSILWHPSTCPACFMMVFSSCKL